MAPAPDLDDATSALLAQVRGWLDRSRATVALTGAGISTDSGIPDFRGPQGVWTKDPAAERMATIDYYLGDPEVRRRAWRNRVDSPARAAEPNPAHLALVALERRGTLQAIVTQNIDELHQRAGSDPARVIEIHGTMRWTTCMSCGDRKPMEEVLERVRSGETDPPCEAGAPRCGGILKSATISFGESLDPEVLARAHDAATSCDLLLAVGTSLAVHPAASLVPVAHRTGARVAIVNAEPTPYDGLADAVVRGPIGLVLPAMAATGGGS